MQNPAAPALTPTGRQRRHLHLLALLCIILTSCTNKPQPNPCSICGQWRVVNDIPLMAWYPADTGTAHEARMLYDSCTGFTITITDTSFTTGRHSICFADRDFGFDTTFVMQMQHNFKLTGSTFRTFQQDSADIGIPDYCYHIYTANHLSKVQVFNTNYTIDNCEVYGRTLTIYRINDNQLMIPFCGFQLFVLQRETPGSTPPVQPYAGGYIDSFYHQKP